MARTLRHLGSLEAIHRAIGGKAVEAFGLVEKWSNPASYCLANGFPARNSRFGTFEVLEREASIGLTTQIGQAHPIPTQPPLRFCFSHEFQDRVAAGPEAAER